MPYELDAAGTVTASPQFSGRCRMLSLSVAYSFVIQTHMVMSMPRAPCVQNATIVYCIFLGISTPGDLSQESDRCKDDNIGASIG